MNSFENILDQDLLEMFEKFVIQEYEGKAHKRDYTYFKVKEELWRRLEDGWKYRELSK